MSAVASAELVGVDCDDSVSSGSSSCGTGDDEVGCGGSSGAECSDEDVTSEWSDGD